MVVGKAGNPLGKGFTITKIEGNVGRRRGDHRGKTNESKKKGLGTGEKLRRHSK